MDRVKAGLVEHAEAALEAVVGLVSPPPPGPPPPWPPGYPDIDGEPDAAAFVGSIVFFISFASSLADVLEHEACFSCFRSGRGGDVEYAEFPLYNAMALGVGSLSYFLAFFGYPAFQLDAAGHILLTGVVFVCFVRHIGKLNDMGKRRLNTLCGLAIMPFMTLACAKAERIKFRSCKMLTMVLATIATLPLGALFRDYKSAMYEPRASKLRKRMFFLFIILFLYIVVSMPLTVCSKRLMSVGHSNVLLSFDLFTLLLGSDAVWSA
jgi:hypothetical protein